MLQESAVGVTVSTDNEAYIRNKAILYGANNPSLVLITHQQRMNTASQSLALANPNLLNDRRKPMKMVTYISMERADQSISVQRVIHPHLVVQE